VKVVGLGPVLIEFDPAAWDNTVLEQQLHLIALEAARRELPKAGELHQIVRAWQRCRLYGK